MMSIVYGTSVYMETVQSLWSKILLIFVELFYSIHTIATIHAVTPLRSVYFPHTSHHIIGSSFKMSVKHTRG